MDPQATSRLSTDFSLTRKTLFATVPILSISVVPQIRLTKPSMTWSGGSAPSTKHTTEVFRKRSSSSISSYDILIEVGGTRRIPECVWVGTTGAGCVVFNGTVIGF